MWILGLKILPPYKYSTGHFFYYSKCWRKICFSVDVWHMSLSWNGEISLCQYCIEKEYLTVNLIHYMAYQAGFLILCMSAYIWIDWLYPYILISVSLYPYILILISLCPYPYILIPYLISLYPHSYILIYRLAE